ncbi:unnamed protein product [Urochloa humidicola]
MGGGSVRLAAALVALVLTATTCAVAAQLRRNYYAGVCPNVESIVRSVMARKVQQTATTVGATVRLFFHDCFVYKLSSTWLPWRRRWRARARDNNMHGDMQGCDASVMVASTGNNTAEKDHPNNLSLAGDGFDAVMRAKAAVDAVPQCRDKVSCADILAVATRDAIALAGGPSYAVELGRMDGLRSTKSSVDGKLPAPFFNLDQLNRIFAANGLSQADMIALSAGHTVGLAHCGTFSGRLRGSSAPDPTMDRSYAARLQAECPASVDPRVAVSMDPVTPVSFDNQYFKNLQAGMGLLASDQVLTPTPGPGPP